MRVDGDVSLEDLWSDLRCSTCNIDVDINNLELQILLPIRVLGGLILKVFY